MSDLRTGLQMRSRALLLLPLAVLALWGSSPLLHAQEAELRAILRKFKNYRYGNISVFRLDGQVFADVQELLNPMPKAPDVVGQLQAQNPALFQQIQDRVTLEGCAADVQEVLRKLREEDGVPASLVQRAETIEAIKYAVQVMQNNCNAFKNAFVVTTRYRPGEPFSIIALIKTRDRSRTIARDLRAVQDVDILLYTDLRRIAAPIGSPSATLYDYLANAVVQGAVENVTLEAQGIGDEDTYFAPPTFGNAEPVSEDDLSLYTRISDGQPLDYHHPNELLVSFPDLVRYRRYERPTTEEATGNEEEAPVYNRQLPRLGLELRYGLEELNYPSVWSQRLTLSALWSSARLGVVLPTSGWKQLNSAVGGSPRLTSAGWGIYGSVDFPVKLIQEGGVFRASASYVFGDARRSDHQVWNEALRQHTDFLIRYHAQMHYSFAIAVDKNYFFRFQLGGTLYGAETWGERVDTTEDRELQRRFVRKETQTIGGISGGIEYMATGIGTPYGFAVQYFDDTVLGTLWLQIPISSSLAVRFDGKVFATLLRDPRLWEHSTLFLPSVRLLLNF
jgi:hypothetical protein